MSINKNKYNLDPKLKCVKCQEGLPWLKCDPDHFRYFVNGKGDYYCDACLPHDLLEQRIEREHFSCHCWGGKLFNKCHDLRRNIRNNPLYWDNGIFKFECYYCGGKLGKNGEKIYECEEPHCERKFCSCSCRSRTLRCRKPNHQTENNQNSPNENFEQRRKDWQRIHEKAQSWWDTLSQSEREQECQRLVENMKQGKYWANNVEEGEGSGWTVNETWWTIKNGQFVSRYPHLVPIQIAEEFMGKELGTCDVLAIEWKWVKGKSVVAKDNNSPSQLAPTDNIKKDANHDNQPNSPLTKQEKSPQNDIKNIKITNEEGNNKLNPAKSTEKSPNRVGNETLIIDLKNIKKVTLRADGKLEIEFNNGENSISQVITTEQINHSQELQTIKNYCQKSGKSSLSRFELDKIFSTNETNVRSAGKSTDNNHALVIGLSVAVALIIGLAIGLLLKRKKSN